MECPAQCKNGVGLWNCPRVDKYSKETQELVQLMMRESRVTHFQQRQIHKQLKEGGALPLMSELSRSAAPPRGVSVTVTAPRRAQKRSEQQCRAGLNYTREAFRPSATRDLEKEKLRLQNILATGHDGTQAPHPRPASPGREEEHEKDRFQELLDEIEDRKQFLEEMTALECRKQYENIINTEICQKIRELELIDRARSEDLRRLMMKEKEKDDEKGGGVQ